jgi:hypothetical protein
VAWDSRRGLSASGWSACALIRGGYQPSHTIAVSVDRLAFLHGAAERFRAAITPRSTALGSFGIGMIPVDLRLLEHPVFVGEAHRAVGPAATRPAIEKRADKSGVSNRTKPTPTARGQAEAEHSIAPQRPRRAVVDETHIGESRPRGDFRDRPSTRASGARGGSNLPGLSSRDTVRF